MPDPIFYRTVGSGDPLVLIHGGFNDGLMAWRKQMESLAPHHRLIVPDRRGHGQSPRDPRPYTIAGDAQDVIDVINREGIDQFHLAGHSYGGLVAMELSRLIPERIQTLHLIEPPYLGLLADDPDIKPIIDLGLLVHNQAAEWGGERAAETFFTMLTGPENTAKMSSGRGWELILRESIRIADEQPPAEYPPANLDHWHLSVPTQVYTGGQSHPGMQKLAHLIAQKISGSTLIEIPEANHAVQYAVQPFDRALLAVTNHDTL